MALSSQSCSRSLSFQAVRRPAYLGSTCSQHYKPTYDAVVQLKALLINVEYAEWRRYSDYKDYLFLDNDFHRTLVGLAENEFILKAWPICMFNCISRGFIRRRSDRQDAVVR